MTGGTCTRGYNNGCRCGRLDVAPRTSVHKCNDWTNCQLYTAWILSCWKI